MLTIIKFYYHNFCYQIFSNLLLDSEFENEAESEPNADEDRNEVGNLRSGRPIMLGLHIRLIHILNHIHFIVASSSESASLLGSDKS